MKTVSAILTTYNGEKTVAQTVESILGQKGVGSKFQIELIVVDDCSTDSTVAILKNYELTLLSTGRNSGGPNRGRNIGLKASSGQFISIVDQDDVWENDRIMTLLPYSEDHSIVSSGYTLVNEREYTNETRVNRSTSGFLVYARNRTFLDKLSASSKGQTRYLGSLLFSSALGNNLFEETYGMVDFDWTLRLFYGQETIEVCQVLYQRRISGNNLSLNEAYRKADFEHSLSTIKRYEAEFPVEVGNARLRIHGRMARYYYTVGDMQKARYYFFRSGLNLKTVLYWMTTFAGHSLVKRKFRVFG